MFIVSLPPFQDLIDAHWRDVARLSYALAGPTDAEDIAQQAWTQALAAYPTLRSTTNLRGWLLTITSRCATDAHRARTRRAVPVETLPDRPPRSGLDPDVAVVESRLAESGASGLWRAVRDLPERQRTAIALRYIVDLDHADLARALGTTPGATRRLVSDGLARLRTTTEAVDRPEESR